MNDLISRQAVLDIVLLDPGITSWQLEMINNLPSEQPERKRGRWIAYEDEDGEHYGDKCSECGEWYVMPYGKTNSCPNCGADMRGEGNDL